MQAQSLGREDPTQLFLCGKSQGHRSLLGYKSWGRQRVGHDLATKQQQHPPMNRAVLACLSAQLPAALLNFFFQCLTPIIQKLLHSIC